VEALRSLVVLVVVIYAALAVFALLFANRMMFMPPAAGYRAGGAEHLTLRTADGVEISAVHLPVEDATYTVLHSHGNAEDLGHIRPVLEEIRRAGFAVFAYDYRGYGPGARTHGPSELGAYLDIEAAYRYLTTELGVAPERIIVHGRSLGGGPSTELALREPVAGLVLESSFTTAYRVLTRLPLLPFDRFRNIAKLPAVGCPVLVIHGTRDRVIPFSHGPALLAAAPEPKLHLWVEEAGHNDLLWVAGPAYGEAFRRFGALIAERQGLDGSGPATPPVREAS
jgi:abhydrolase domain-containing protein 17